MPRTARKISDSKIYHVMTRGINKQTIFKDSNDIHYYLQVLQNLKKSGEFELFSYCFLNNHVHLLIRESTESISQIMRRLGSKYVYWYNRKYARVGYLFQDRFKSEPVEDDSYFLTVLRYIHQNPLKAGLSNSLLDYKWSSYHDYLNFKGITDIDFALNIFSPDRKKALNHFIDFHDKVNNDSCLEMEAIQRFSDDTAAKIIVNECKIDKPSDLKDIKKPARDTYLRNLKTNHTLSIRQIEKLTGINRNIIARA